MPTDTATVTSDRNVAARTVAAPEPNPMPNPPIDPGARPEPAPAPNPPLDPEVTPDPNPMPNPPAPKASAKSARRTRVIEVDEELHEFRDTTAIRLEAGQKPYSIWDCPDSPGEKIRINSSEVLRFRNGNLECRDETDDAAVERANTFAGGKYLRADPAYLNDPFDYNDGKGRTTLWHSKRAFERYVALHPRES